MHKVEERLLNAGYDGVIYLVDESYDDALVGVSDDERAIYDFELMVKWLVDKYGFDEIEAIEFIEYNTIRSLSYMGDKAPIIMYKLLD